MFSQGTSPALPMQEYIARLVFSHLTGKLKSILGQEEKPIQKNILKVE